MSQLHLCDFDELGIDALSSCQLDAFGINEEDDGRFSYLKGLGVFSKNLVSKLSLPTFICKSGFASIFAL